MVINSDICSNERNWALDTIPSLLGIHLRLQFDLNVHDGPASIPALSTSARAPKGESPNKDFEVNPLFENRNPR